MAYTTTDLINATQAAIAAPAGSGVTGMVTAARTAVGGQAITPANILTRNQATVNTQLAKVTGSPAAPLPVGIAAPSPSGIRADIDAADAAIRQVGAHINWPVVLKTGSALAGVALAWKLWKGRR